MKLVYIVTVQGWGDDENAFYNISAHSTRALAEQAVVDITEEAFAEDEPDPVTEIQVLTVK